jgi:hypothetical protein
MADLVVGPDLSSAWARALALLIERGGAAVNFNVTFPAAADDDPAMRERLDGLLAVRGKGRVETVANTIFPSGLYATHLGDDAAAHLFRVHELTMRVHRRRNPNDRDTYFNRLVAYPTKDGPFNQLDYVISRLRKQMPLRSANSSAYEIGLSDPASGELVADAELRIQAPGKDRNIYGFPCLSHMSLTLERPRLHLTALYRNQTFVERAYGNYLGLSRLLRFVCAEVGCKPGEVQCTATHASAQLSEHGKTRVAQLAEDVSAMVHPREEVARV